MSNTTYMKASDDLGPLPQSCREHELAALSLARLKNVLPVETFVFREETISDVGVDGSLELKIESRYTNLRAQAQIKSTDSQETNRDGSISVEVKVSNLNHLLNGYSPLYFLYIAPRDEFRFLWALDEEQRLDQQKPNWKKQEDVRLRFREILTAEGLSQIHGRIRLKAQCQRRISESLSRRSMDEKVVISIDVQTLATIDARRAKEILLSSGMTIVASGYASFIIDMFRLISGTDATAPRLQLIMAYAYSTLGRYQAAIAHMQEAMLRREDLSPEDQEFAEHLRNACEYSSGHIGLAEYEARQESLEANSTRVSGLYRFANQLDRLRERTLDELDLTRREALLDELRTLVNEVVESSTVSEAFKLEAQLALIHEEGAKVAYELFLELHKFHMQLRLGRITRQHRIEGFRQQWMQFEAQTSVLLQNARALRHPLLLASALDTRLTIRLAILINLRLSEMLCGMTAADVPDAFSRDILRDATQAIEISKKAENIEGELSGMLHIADLCMLTGKREQSVTLANEVLPKARAMNYTGLVVRAEEHISGNTLLSKTEARVRLMSTEDQDPWQARLTDDEVEDTAADYSEALDLPLERLPVVQRECFSMRAIASERLLWCRHIELIQDLGHTERRSTHYKTDPNRHCLCLLHRYESAIGATDWRLVISSFKTAYCAACPDRDPKQRD